MIRTYQINATNITNADVAALSIVQRLGIVSTAIIQSYSVSKIYAENAFALPASADLQNQLVISAGIAGKPNKRANLSIPAPHALNFLGTSGDSANKPNFGWTWLDTFLALFTTGSNCMVSDGEFIDKANVTGKRVHKKP